MQPKIGLCSLGCPKNQVDAEIMLASLQSAGFEITLDEMEADILIVNTCGFIESAKQEAIETILDAAERKKEGELKAIMVTGCMAERYRDEILNEIPEVDIIMNLGGNKSIVEAVQSLPAHQSKKYYGNQLDLPLKGKRMLLNQPFWSYLKIAEGCDNCCSYCAIPLIRGPYRSRTKEDILAEAVDLAGQGVKELVLVAQDTTRYGEDIYGKLMLPDLLTELCKVKGVDWLRLLYCYPDRVTDELLEVMSTEQKILSYMDLPLQHCDGDILRAMNRSGDEAQLKSLIQKIRLKVPGIKLRTTFITGFPGETQAQFESLSSFVKEMEFDRLGCFAYSAEEDTPAACFLCQLDEQEKANRAEIIMTEQSRIAEKLNRLKQGQVLTVLTEGTDDYIKCYYGRSEAHAPDIDGKVFFTSNQVVRPGEFVKVRITGTIEFDLLGEAEKY